MARYIDADLEVSKYVTVWDCDCSEFGKQTVMAVDDLHYLPTADVAPRAEWISVEERLPERMKPVLVLATGRYEEDGYDVLIAYHDGGEWEEQCVHSHECCSFYIYAHVKFWMPLPEPLKGD